MHCSLSLFSIALLVLGCGYHSASASVIPRSQDIQMQGSKLLATCSGVWSGVDVDSETVSQPSLANQMKTAQTVIDAYNDWNIKGSKGVIEYRTPDCQHHVLPSSMGRSVQSNAQYLEHLERMRPDFSNFTVMVHKEVHDAGARTCMIHASSMADTKIGPYANEYALLLTFTKDGKKVVKFDEFVDSEYSRQFFAALAREQT